VQWKGGKDRVEKMRAIKDETEIEQIREAIRFAERAFDMFRSMLRPEEDRERAERRHGNVHSAGRADVAPAFRLSLAWGREPRCRIVRLGNNRVSQSDLLLVDWGASGRFYKSDLTRVLLPRKTSRLSSRDVDPKAREIYDIVLRAQLAAIAALRPGAKSGDMDAAARDVIMTAGYGENFTHSVGHGIGMAVHEMPMMRANTEIVLQAGMVVTVETRAFISPIGAASASKTTC